MKQIVVNGINQNISLYADDLLLTRFLLHHVLKIFRKFSLISVLKINLNKSFLTPENALRELKLNTELQAVKNVRYLEIDVYASLDINALKNYINLQIW